MSSSNPAEARDCLRDLTTVTLSVQDVANRLHQKIYGANTEHFGLHSCPCFNFARFYLGLDPYPKMYWPDGKGGNKWQKELQQEVELESVKRAQARITELESSLATLQGEKEELEAERERLLKELREAKDDASRHGSF